MSVVDEAFTRRSVGVDGQAPGSAKPGAERAEIKMTLTTSIQALSRLKSRLHRPARPAPMTTMEWVRLAPELMNEIEPDDPLIGYLIQNPDVTKVDRLPLDSPAVRALRETGYRWSCRSSARAS